MKRLVLSHHMIVVLASLALLGLGLLQANWVWTSYRMKKEEIHHELSRIAPTLAVQIKIQEELIPKLILKGEQRVSIPAIESTVDSMMRAAGFSVPIYFALFQKGEEGFYAGNTSAYKEELKHSTYNTCLSCIVTYRFQADSTAAVTPEMTSIRPVSEMKRLPGYLPHQEFLWFSMYLPKQGVLSQQAIGGLLILSFLMMGLLVFLFSYILRSLAQQKQLSQMKDDFFNNLTHEFKTPLGAIRLASSVLRQATQPEKKEIYLNLIAHESKKLEEQVDRMLQLSILDVQQDALDKEPMDLHVAIKEVIERLRLLMEQREAQVKMDLQLEKSEVVGDYNHLSNCLYNLIDNAIKYSGLKPRIEISTYLKNGQQCISVKDHGPGIPAIHQEAIFDRFYRAQQDDRYKGNGFGIGLSYVKTIVEAHQGTIILNKAYKDGCEFIITL